MRPRRWRSQRRSHRTPVLFTSANANYLTTDYLWYGENRGPTAQPISAWGNAPGIVPHITKGLKARSITLPFPIDPALRGRTNFAFGEEFQIRHPPSNPHLTFPNLCYIPPGGVHMVTKARPPNKITFAIGVPPLAEGNRPLASAWQSRHAAALPLYLDPGMSPVSISCNASAWPPSASRQSRQRPKFRSAPVPGRSNDQTCQP